MKPYKTMKEYNSGLQQHYIHQMPSWMRLFMFIKRGTYGGFANARTSRILCWFDRHDWGPFRYGEYEGSGSFHYQCRRCGMPSKKVKNG